MATDRPLALVTGASSGIGAALADRFAQSGHDLIVVARRADRLESLAARIRDRDGIEVTPITADLSAPDAAASLAARLDADGHRPDVLVNNAGFGRHGRVDRTPAEDLASMVRLNVGTLADLTRRLLPAMIERRRGGVMNVASTAAFQAGPGMTVYFATKAFVLSFSEGLAHELRGTGVRCCCLCPGPTETEFGEAAGMSGMVELPAGAMTTDAVCDIAMRGWRRGDAIIVPGMVNRFGTILPRFVPRPLVRRLAAHFVSADLG